MRRPIACAYLTLAVFFSLFVPLVAFMSYLSPLIGSSDRVFYLAVSFTASLGLSAIAFIECVLPGRR